MNAVGARPRGLVPDIGIHPSSYPAVHLDDLPSLVLCVGLRTVVGRTMAADRVRGQSQRGVQGTGL